MIKKLVSNSPQLFTLLLSLIIVMHYWWPLLCNVLIMLSFLLVLLQKNARTRLINTYSASSFWLLSVPFWLTLLGLFHTEDMGLGGFMVEKRLAIAVLPLLMYAIPQVHKNKIIEATVFGGFSSLLFCLGQSIFLYYSGQSGTEVFYSDLLAYPLFGQAVYVAYMINCWILLIVYQLVRQEGILGRLIFGIPLILFLLVFHFLLASRMSMLVLIIVSTVFFALYGAQKIGWVKSIGALGALIVFVLGMAFMFPKSLNRFRNIDKFSFNYENKSPLNHFNAEFNEQNWTGITVRLAIWNSIWEDMDTEWTIGNGSGDVEGTLLKGYEARNFYLGLEQNFNTHNQYLDFTLSTGMLGLFVFAGSLLFLLGMSIRSGNYLFAVFLMISMLTMMTENIMNRNMGIMFYAFLSGFLFFLHPKDKKLTR